MGVFNELVTDLQPVCAPCHPRSTPRRRMREKAGCRTAGLVIGHRHYAKFALVPD